MGIINISKKILKTFYDLFRKSPGEFFEKKFIYDTMNDEDINETDFEAAIRYMEGKKIIELKKFLGGNWIGRITSYGIEKIAVLFRKVWV